MRDTAYRNLDAGPHLRPGRHLGQPLLQPILVAVEEFLHLAPPQARRHGDAQAPSTRIDAQRQAAGAVVLDDLERQRTAGDNVLALFDGVADTEGRDADSLAAYADVIDRERENCETSGSVGIASNAGGVPRGFSARMVRSFGRAERYALSGVACGARRRGTATVVFDRDGSAGTDAEMACVCPVTALRCGYGARP